MNVIFRNWLDINRASSSESLCSEDNYKKNPQKEDVIEQEVLNLKKELENTEKINFNLKLTIDQLSKKIKKLNSENKSYKLTIQILLSLSLICNIYLYSKINK